MSPFYQDHENEKYLLHVFDPYMPKRISGANCDGSYYLSDVDDEMDDKDGENNANGDMVSSEEK